MDMGDLTTSDSRATPTEPRGHLLSSQRRAVLQALAAAADGRLATADVRRRVERPGASDSVTRASVSRTLRRLWRAGLVELADGDRKTLKAEAERLQHLADAVDAQPDVAYRAYLERLRRNGQRDRYGSATRYAAAWRATARRIPHLRARQVRLTITGRQAVNSAMLSNA
jgi:DNA-binding transcriptional ArsR family regulator